MKKKMLLGKNLDHPIVVKAGQVIFNQFEESRYLYILKSGEVYFFKKHSKGPHQLSLFKIAHPHEVLNEVSVLRDRPIEFLAIAKTDCEVILIEKTDVLTVVNKSPAWVPNIFQTLCERLIATEEIIEEHNLHGSDLSGEFALSKADEAKFLAALLEYEEQ